MQEASACKAPPSSLADVCGFGGRVWHSDVLDPHCVCCLGPKRTWLLVLTSQCLLAHTPSRPSNSQNRSRSGYQDLSRFAIPWATHEQTGCKCLHRNPQTHPPALLGVQLQGGGWGQPDSFLLPGQVRPSSSPRVRVLSSYLPREWLPCDGIFFPQQEGSLSAPGSAPSTWSKTWENF